MSNLALQPHEQIIGVFSMPYNSEPFTCNFKRQVVERVLAVPGRLGLDGLIDFTFPDARKFGALAWRESCTAGNHAAFDAEIILHDEMDTIVATPNVLLTNRQIQITVIGLKEQPA